MIIFWLIALIIFIVVEAVTIGLVSIWFAIGALAAFISALLGASIWMQLVWFIVITAVTIVVTRPLAKKYLSPKHRPTNADRVIDMVGVVMERIDNLSETGSVHVGGRFWRARSANGEVIEAGEKVRSVRIEGVKLIVVTHSEAQSAADAVK